MKKLLSLILAALMLTAYLCAFAALEAETFSPAAISAITRTALLLQEDGTFTRKPVGDPERFCAYIQLDKSLPAGTLIDVAAELKYLKPDADSFCLRLSDEAGITPVKQTATLTDTGVALLTLDVDGKTLVPGAQACLYFEAARTEEQGEPEITVKLSARKATAFTAGQSAMVEGYRLSRQGEGGDPLEQPVGLSGTTEKTSVYIISKDGAEKLRVAVDGGEVLGLAKYDAECGMVVSLEYNLAGKVYVNALTQKEQLTKAELLEIMNALDFSFLKAPDESAWLARQPEFSSQKGIRLKKAAEAAVEEKPAL